MAGFIKRRGGILISVATLVLAGATVWWWLFIRLEPGMVRYNPSVPLQPDREYHLEFWDYLWPTAPDGGMYEPWLKKVLADFTKSHPNIKVRYRLLDWEQGTEEVRRSLRAGNPPDLYAPVPGAGLLFDERLQVPAGLYMTEEERGEGETGPAFLEPALSAADFDGRVMAWPRWLVVGVWLGNGAALAASGIETEEIVAGRLDRDTLADALAARPPMVAGLAVNPEGAGVLVDLMHAAGASTLLSVHGDRQWLGSAVLETVTWLEELRHNEVIPAINRETADLMVEQVFQGKAAVLAGANPWLTARLVYLARGEGDDTDNASDEIKENPGLVFLPPPAPTGIEPVLRADAANLIVFRQDPYKGHDHTAAAMELARFLSRHGHPWALPDTPSMPSFLPAWRSWADASRGPGKLLARMIDRLSHDPPRPAAVVWEEERILGEEVATAMADFWAGKLDARAVAQRLGVETPPAREEKPPWWHRLWRRP